MIDGVLTWVLSLPTILYGIFFSTGLRTVITLILLVTVVIAIDVAQEVIHDRGKPKKRRPKTRVGKKIQ